VVRSAITKFAKTKKNSKAIVKYWLGFTELGHVIELAFAEEGWKIMLINAADSAE